VLGPSSADAHCRSSIDRRLLSFSRAENRPDFPLLLAFHDLIAGARACLSRLTPGLTWIRRQFRLSTQILVWQTLSFAREVGSMARSDVIYNRFSTDMQNPKSCTDQEHDVRAGLDRLGIDHRRAKVVHDAAESGTKVLRSEFQQLLEMMSRGEIGLLAVDDQARLTRATNAYAFISDLVYSGGRFISTGEGIDTNQPGWELRVKVMELHNSTTIHETGRRVRRGQEGRIRANLTAGDYSFGYESFIVNPSAVDAHRRGPKPERNIRINENEARWVRQICEWFLLGMSLNAIARRLNELNVPLGRRCRNKEWEHRHIASILANCKYAGQWAFGKTTTIRNSQGKTKQILLPQDRWTVTSRPDLRMVDQSTWDQVQARLAELHVAFGRKEGQKKRGRKPQIHCSEFYPAGLLNGLLYCGECGAKLHHRGSDQYKYLGCPNVASGACTMRTFVHVPEAKRALIDLLRSILFGTPEWVDSAIAAMRAALAEISDRTPSEIVADEKQLRETRAHIDNLVDGLARGGCESEAVMKRLEQLESLAKALEANIESNRRQPASSTSVPDSKWVAEQMHELGDVLEEDSPNAATLLRKLLGKVTVHAVIPPGKKRGYVQLRFRISFWEAISSVMTPNARQELAGVLASAGHATDVSDGFCVDVGGPTRMDHWGPQIAEMRAQGMISEEIYRITGLGSGPAYVAWKRYVDYQKENRIGDETGSTRADLPGDDDRGQGDAA
jgi:site-specific DNA recombinase